MQHTVMRVLIGALTVAVSVVIGVSAARSAPDMSSRSQQATEEVTSPLPAPPQVRARAWAVVDGRDGQLLAGDNAEAARPIASLTKIMTALVVVERTQGDEKVRISKRAQAAGDGSEVDMKAGQTYPVDTLLDAMLIYSANDAAVALAEYVGNDEAGFIKMMNDKADSLDLASTTFTSVNGLDSDKLTTASPTDVVELATNALKDPRIRAAVAMRTITVTRPGATQVKLENRNSLLGTYDGVDGVKTGFTDAAGHCLLIHWSAPDDPSPIADETSTRAADEPTAEEIVSGAESDTRATPAQDNDLWVVVLGEPDDPARFEDARALLDWARPLRQSFRFASAGDVITSVPVAGSGDPVRLYLSDDVRGEARVGDEIVERVSIPPHLTPPLKPGDKVGHYEIRVGDTVIGESDMYVNEQVREESRSDRVKRYLSSWDDAALEGFRTTRSAARRFARYWGIA